MKKLSALILTLAICGCASDQSMPQTAGNPDTVKLGMTKAEVLKALDGHKPNNIQTSPRSEVWNYNNAALAYIPFNFGFRPEFKSYTFDTNGVLIDFSTTKPTK
jgi:hypothetical protein